jgi:hypothetical protein
MFTLTLPYNNTNRAAFTLDSFVEIYRTSPITGQLIKEDTYLARSFNRYRQGNEERYVISGPQLNDLAKRRIIDPTSDPNAAGGYSTYAGAADTVMYWYTYYNMGPGAPLARQVPNLSIPIPPGTGNSVGYRLRYDNLFTAVLADATARGNVDFNIQRTIVSALELDLAIVGTDRRQSKNYPTSRYVGLDPKRGNMQDPNLLIDRRSEKTYVYALGQGQDVNRQLFPLAGTNSADSPFNRIEYVESANNVAKGDTTGLRTAAVASLKKNYYAQDFSFKLLEFQPGNVYQLDWFLGDLITATYDDFSQELRIVGVEVFVNQQGQTVQPKVSTI